MKNHAGQLDRHVNLYAPTFAQDATGQPIATWDKVASLWAQCRFEHGKTSAEGDEPVESSALVVKIRYLPQLSSSWRLDYGTDRYRIVSIREFGRRQWQEIKCERLGDNESGQ